MDNDNTNPNQECLRMLMWKCAETIDNLETSCGNNSLAVDTAIRYRLDVMSYLKFDFDDVTSADQLMDTWEMCASNVAFDADHFIGISLIPTDEHSLTILHAIEWWLDLVMHWYADFSETDQTSSALLDVGPEYGTIKYRLTWAI